MNDRRLAAVAAVAMVPAIALVAAGAIEAATVVVLAGLAATTVPVDLRERRIPTPVVHTVAVGESVAVIAARVARERSVAGAAVGALLVGGVFLVVHVLDPTGLGFGDVRLATVVSGAVGWSFGVPVAIEATVVAAVAAAVGGKVRRGGVPFAPILLAAALAVVTALLVAG
jgi:leader peptidase (prepilin peptidase)/N-methyltransferase